MATSESFDLLVIGSGPAGQKGAIAAAKLGKRVAIVDKNDMMGGTCVHGGTIPSKTLREAILYLTGYRQRSFYGNDYTLKEQIGMDDLSVRVRMVIQREMAIIKDQLRRNGVKIFHGEASFEDANTIRIESELECYKVKADNILIACGTRPARNEAVPCDGQRILDADQVECLTTLPREMIVVGAGVIGLEYASMFTALGVEVTVVDERPVILDFVDRELIESLCYHMRQRGATFRLGEKVEHIEIDEQERVVVHTDTGKRIRAHVMLYCVGRQANSDKLNLAAAGIEADKRGKITVNEHFQTCVPHIYAAGDVIGFPALASTSTEQGRLAGRHMFGLNGNHSEKLLPYGIYAIPEISMVGKTEAELTADKIPYEFGLARYNELAKGQIVGDATGLLKILFHPDTLKIHGVHVIGESAAEIVHIGQAVMELGGTIEYLRDAVFNYPTFAEAYKVAALDGMNKLA